MTQQYYDQGGQYGGQPQGYAPAQPQYAPNPYQQPAPHQTQVWGGVQPPPQGYGYAPAPQGYQQTPQYGQQPPQGPPPQDLSGDLDSFYSQRSTTGGKGISWKGVPDGYTVQGVVTRKITNGDVFKETYPPQHPQAGQVQTNRDGSFKYAMQVPLKLHILDQFQARDFPDGEARLFLRGGLRDEVTRAMAEVGAPEGPPEAGAFVRVTLTHRKPGNNIATNMFAVLYRSPGQWENDPNLNAIQHHMAPPQPAPAGQVYGGAPQQAPYQQQAPAQYAAPVQAAPNPQQYAPQQYGQQAYAPNPQAMPGNQAAVSGPAAQQQYGQAYPQGAEHAAPQGYAPQPAPNPNPNTQGLQQAPQDQGTQPAQYGQQVNPSQGPAQWQQAAPNPNEAQGQQQLPYGGQPQQAPAPPQQPPVQTGVQQSALDPRRQELLNRLGGQQGQPAGQPPG